MGVYHVDLLFARAKEPAHPAGLKVQGHRCWVLLLLWRVSIHHRDSAIHRPGSATELRERRGGCHAEHLSDRQGVGWPHSMMYLPPGAMTSVGLGLGARFSIRAVRWLTRDLATNLLSRS